MRIPTWPRLLTLPAALTLLVVGALAVACGSTDTSDDPLTVGGMSETVVMDGSKFRPGNLQVPVGAAVTFENHDSAVHDAKAKDGSWETSELRRDETETVTFDSAGEWLYVCTIHPSMKARITVVDTADSTREGT
jgi:plastocyanin